MMSDQANSEQDSMFITHPHFDMVVASEAEKGVERPSSVTIGMIQFPANPDKTANIQQALSMAWKAADANAQIIAFHEMFMLPWVFADTGDTTALAESAESAVWAPFRTLAKERQVVLVCSFYERGEGDTYYNAALVIDADGETAGRYRKHHLPPDNERAHFNLGDGVFRAIETRYGKIGVYVCWDNFFFEGARAIALDGAHTVFAPTAATSIDGKYRWELALRNNAMLNQCYWVRCNRIEPPFYGANFVAAPDGNVLVGPLDDKEAITVTTLDLTKIDQERQEWTFLTDRRPDQYRSVSG